MAVPPLSITKNETGFCHDLIELGMSVEEAYSNNWSVKGKKPSNIRYMAKKMMKKDTVQKYMDNLMFERKQVSHMDEKFVTDHLKEAALRNKGTTVGVRALELLGKSLGMFKERQIIEDSTGHRASANKLFELADKMAKGEDVSDEINKLEGNEEQETEVYEFQVSEG